MASITEVFTTLDKDMVLRACSWSKGCIKAAIEAKSDYIEIIIILKMCNFI